MRKLLVVCGIVLCSIFFAGAQRSASPRSAARIRGSVLDASGNAIPAAEVSLTQSDSGAVAHTVADANGQYELDGLAPGIYTLAASKAGFVDYHQDSLQLGAGQMLNADISMSLPVVTQSVTVHGGALDGVTAQPSQEQVLVSNQSIRVIDRQQMSIVGPVAGGAQAISTAPGAIVTGYGNTGATKYTVTLNGLNQGWGGYGGYTGGAALGVTFDGVPIVDPATSLWPSATIPENGLIQNLNVTYGPGSPADRWYTNVGGAVEFTPVQPTEKPQANVTATYGSYQQKDLVANASSGLHHGWSVVLGGGAGKGDDFRKAPDGFKNPGKDWAVLGKALKAFNGNSFELGSYYAYAGGYRSQVIPVVANPYITMDGTATGQVYSQHTSGFFSTLPFNSYNKYDANQMGLIYGRENIRLDNTTTVQNLSWYMHVARLHARYTDVYQNNSGTDGNQQQNEYNNPYTNTIGDKLLLTKTLPWNTVSGGGYYIHALYNSRNNFYGPAWGGAKRTANVGGKIRSSYFNQSDFAIFLQDDIHPVPMLHITPGIRYVGFAASFYNAVQQDFNLAPGATLSTTCRYGNFGGVKGTVSVQDACPAANENRSGVEPSVDVAVQARPWLSLYGGFQEALRAPQLGGGGGMFQAVDPVSYHLERGTYYQFGFKTHTEGTGFKNNMLFGANYYHNKFANQEIDTTLANGDTFDANGTSNYNGVNIFFDDDPLQNLHLFANANIEAASYSSYVTGGIIYNGQATCNPPSGPIAGCLDYKGYPVSYVPTSTLNAGAFYSLHPKENLTIQPTASFQFVGSQHVFDNCALDVATGSCQSPAPSKSVTMPAYATLNLGAKVPYKRFDFTVMALNVLDKSYDIFQYISAGSYFNTSSTAPSGSPFAYNYVTAYPGAPVTAYVSVEAHF